MGEELDGLHGAKGGLVGRVTKLRVDVEGSSDVGRPTVRFRREVRIHLQQLHDGLRSTHLVSGAGVQKLGIGRRSPDPDGAGNARGLSSS